MKTGVIRILLIEDNPGDEEIVRQALTSERMGKCELFCSHDLVSGLDQLSCHPFDVLLLDLGLPACRDLEALQQVRSQNSEIPVVVLTGQSDEHIALEAIEQGAQDFLLKQNLTSDQLSRSIRFAILRQQLLIAIMEGQVATEERANLAAIVERLDDAVISETVEGAIVSWNRGAERMYGYAAEEVLGKSIALLMPDDRGHEYQEIREAMRDGRHYQCPNTCVYGKMASQSTFH